MTQITFDVMVETLRNLLISASNLNSNMVRNGASMFGAQTLKNVENDIFSTITPDDTLLIFLISQLTDSENSISFDENSKTIHTVAYNSHITIYGNNSAFVGNNCCTSLRTSTFRQEAYDNGIYIESVSTPDIHYEIIQNVVWMRADFDIRFCCEQQYIERPPVYMVEQLSNLYIEGDEEL